VTITSFPKAERLLAHPEMLGKEGIASKTPHRRAVTTLTTVTLNEVVKMFLKD